MVVTTGVTRPSETKLWMKSLMPVWGLWENSSRERGWNWNIAGDVSLLLRAQQVVVPMLTVAEAVKQTYKQ